MNPYRDSDVVLEHDEIRVKLGNIERRGVWTCPQTLDVYVKLGNCELDFREATLGPGLTTIRCNVRFGNLEITVPESMSVDVKVESVAGNVMQHRETTSTIDAAKPRLLVIGTVKMGNCE